MGRSLTLVPATTRARGDENFLFLAVAAVARKMVTTRSRARPADEAPPLRKQLSTRYVTLLVERPYFMQIAQSIALSIVANVCSNQLIAGRPFAIMRVVEQVFISVCLAPATILWLRVLRGYKLHWVKASLADQLGYNVFMNILIFNLLAAIFRGGVRFDGGSVVVKREVFPDLFAWNPIWSTRIKGLSIKLPATLLREKVIPERFKGAWELLVTFVWTMIVAAILARA